MMDDLAEEHYKELEAERAQLEMEAYELFEIIHWQAGQRESPVNAQRGPTVPGDASRGPPKSDVKIFLKSDKKYSRWKQMN